jgi:two-component system chemotaxis response regulator CheV
MTTRSTSDGILLEAGTNEVEFLLFYLDSQPYGINVSKVCQISMFDPAAVRYLPNQRKEVLGVVDFRGKTISVIDLSMHLQIKQTKEITRRLMIVAEFNQRTTAFIVDGVDRIQRCNWDTFKSITDSSCDVTSVLGTVRVPQEGLVIILDLETIMGSIDPTMSIDHYQNQIASPRIDRQNVRIVYCEDSSIVQKVLLRTLDTAGFKTVKTFFTGKDGLEYLQSVTPDQVDVILSDIEMPRMDGLAFCKEVRSMPGFAKKPFIFFSSMINHDMRRKCQTVGADFAFSKPEIQHIVSAIEEVVSQK